MTNRGMIGLVVALSACNAPTGDVTVLLTPEDTIPEGIEPGTGLENIVDGWRVTFSKYVVAAGEVHIERSATGATVDDPSVLLVDLANAPATGVELSRFEGLEAARWDRFAFATTLGASPTRHESASQADFDEMVANGWTVLIEGTLESPTGQSCPPGGACRAAPSIAFGFGADVDTDFGPCQAEDGLPGVVVTEGGTVVSITIHGDHAFFDSFPSGAEIVERRAQWLANADTDGDGRVTQAELAATDAAALFPSDTYSLGGAPISIVTGWDFVRAQLATQGAFQGEGECPWTLH